MLKARLLPSKIGRRWTFRRGPYRTQFFNLEFSKSGPPRWWIAVSWGPWVLVAHVYLLSLWLWGKSSWQQTSLRWGSLPHKSWWNIRNIWNEKNVQYHILVKKMTSRSLLPTKHRENIFALWLKWPHLENSSGGARRSASVASWDTTAY